MPLPTPATDEAIALLQALVRIDTSNPPGHETAAAELLASHLRQDGYEPQLLEAAPGRTNLVVRHKGDGTGGGPLLLTGHLDVAPADATGWKHPPFSAEIAEGWLWGRGTLDMKNHLAACATVMRQIARDGLKLKRDVIFAAVADEEAGCALGSKFLVDQHPDLIRAEYALGELGAFTFHMAGRRLYPIQVGHKGLAWLTLRAKGMAGHGSIPLEDSAPMRLARAVMRLGNMPLPVHVTEPARRMLEGMGRALGAGSSLALKLACRPALTDFVLQNLIRDEKGRRLFGAVLRNTASVTQLKAGVAPNVYPLVAEATVDGRLLPGQATADLLREVRDVVDDDDVVCEAFRELPATESPTDTPLYRLLEEAVRAMDPGGAPYPQLVPGFTDAGELARLGIRTYGFSPLVFPEGEVSLPDLIHGVDERIPLDGFRRGVQTLWDVVLGFCG
ncbi:MAG: M20/M25/M40 family metallo-hydrolase [Deltaproteobacteria bacterium]|nr:M20/M25/M40 family metallo-hydrolase [Deltaproteobacteria bacterium]